MPKRIFFYSCPYLTDSTGKIGTSKIESDIYHHFFTSFEQLGYDVVTPTFVVDAEGFVRPEESVLDKITDKRCDYAIFDINFRHGEISSLPLWLKQFKPHFDLVLGFIPDGYTRPSIESLFESWADFIDIFLTIEPDTPSLYSRFNIAQIQSLPIVKPTAAPKSIDFSYVGSPKWHRMRLLGDVVRQPYSVHISTAGRTSDVCSTVNKYMNVLAASKCSLVTPALTRLRDSSTLPIAGRLFECLASNAIPLYCGSGSKPGVFYAILDRFFNYPTVSRLGVEWAKTAIYPVKSSQDLMQAVKKIKSDPNIHSDWLNISNDLYEKYISPKSVIKEIETLSQKLG